MSNLRKSVLAIMVLANFVIGLSACDSASTATVSKNTNTTVSTNATTTDTTASSTTTAISIATVTPIATRAVITTVPSTTNDVTVAVKTTEAEVITTAPKSTTTTAVKTTIAKTTVPTTLATTTSNVVTTTPATTAAETTEPPSSNTTSLPQATVVSTVAENVTYSSFKGDNFVINFPSNWTQIDHFVADKNSKDAFNLESVTFSQNASKSTITGQYTAESYNDGVAAHIDNSSGWTVGPTSLTVGALTADYALKTDFYDGRTPGLQSVGVCVVPNPGGVKVSPSYLVTYNTRTQAGPARDQEISQFKTMCQSLRSVTNP